MIDHIKEYTKRGWVVHPLSSPKDTGNSPGKKPLMVGWQMLKRTPMYHHFPPGCNIGLVCGKVSDVMVIDYDNMMFITELFGDSWEDTLKSKRTTDRGHLFFRYNPNIKNQKHHMLGIEFLTDGSNAVLPPSVHISGDIYKWTDTNTPVRDMPKDIEARIVRLFSTETELKKVIDRCRACFKRVLKDYPNNIPDVHGSDGRQFMLAICTDLVALGAKEQHLKMFSKLMYREKYDEHKTLNEMKYLDTWKTWRCETLREKLPAYVNCAECVNHKFNRPENAQDEKMRMKVTIPASVKELTLIIEK